ncbi:MAG: transposase, partial [Hyphomicrobiales bacterium]|nr:transposase [Hyphomicrobiales bacterium]
VCNTAEVVELTRLAKTIRRWETPLLRWHTTGLTTGPVEGTNPIIKNNKRLGFGFGNFENYRLRLLLRCGTTWKTPAAPSIRGRQPSLAA